MTPAIPTRGIVLTLFVWCALTAAKSHISEPPYIEPAFTTVPRTSPAGAPLFETETIQLTDSVLRKLKTTPSTAKYAQQFIFDNDKPPNSTRRKGFCKTYPGDHDWPSNPTWDVFDNLLGRGALIPTVPIAAPCYDSKWGPKNEVKCGDVTARFNTPYLHEGDPTSIMFPIYQGRTCMPGNPTVDCTLGGFPQFVVNATTVAQVQLALNFARNNNLRLVVKNTGHDYLGKSTGAGALSIWTNNNKQIEFLLNYQGDGYAGPAMKVGAGVTVREVYAAAEKNGVSALGGISPSVGFSGGYFAGGGHTPLSGLYGMAADHIMAINLVTASGHFMTASARSNPDLYWALRGGGGGTYGVVTSVVVRVHPKVPVTVAKFSFETSQNVSDEAFWLAVRKYYELHIPFTNAGTYSFYFIFNRKETTNGELRFQMQPFFAPNHTIESYNALTKPLFDTLKSLSIPVTFTKNVTYYGSYYPAYMDSWGNNMFPVGTVKTMAGNRILPRGHFQDAAKLNATLEVLKQHVDNGFHLGGYHQAPRNRANVDNAVSTAWREAVSFLIFGSRPVPDNGTVADMQTATDELIDEILKPWKDLAPPSQYGGSYLNEAAVMEPGWQHSFYGLKYEKMLEIKQRWDPRGLFYGPTAVGSEEWEVRDGDRGVQTQDGRLCHV
ncbi:FAD binding domain-containing protein [Delitschia confertaspora ATCC 74209]|uniref:FAD binding domain-containing protein n=1 Tax=Delitschia confertaspora ATCC 74209 TaxID=1513339 RepID=A0A9P4JSE6_9PLEO|nr:FAD binding domain-containing protein [Delitschia confertaspora ATCC 74209]